MKTIDKSFELLCEKLPDTLLFNDEFRKKLTAPFLLFFLWNNFSKFSGKKF